MKRLITIICFGLGLSAWSQTPTYKWLSGSQTARAKSIIETTSPDPRQGAVSFTDSENNYWLFGGERSNQSASNGIFNDLWKYDTSTKTWTWIEGNPIIEQPIPEYNNSLIFDGIDDEIILTNDPVEYDQDFTIEMAIKRPSDFIDRVSILSWSSTNESSILVGWSIELVNNGQEISLFKDGFNVFDVSGLTLFDDNWHQISVVFDPKESNIEGSYIYIYVDGAQVASHFGDILENQDPNDDHVTTIGVRRGFGSSFYFDGHIDEVRFWNDVRTADEIFYFRNTELQGNEEGLAAYYDFNQGLANSDGNYETELLDKTVNANHGMLGDVYREGVFVGQMAEVRVWNSVLDENQIRSVAYQRVTGIEANLQAAYNFSTGVPDADNTALSTIADITVNGRVGEINNFSLVGSESNFISSNLPASVTSFPSPFEITISKIGDFDEDGWDDIITSSSNTNISLFINDEAGGISGYTEFSAVNEVFGLTIGDWNEDDNLDVAVTAHDDAANNRIRIFFGDGAGGFPSSFDIDPGDLHPTGIEMADMNGDDNEDLVVLVGESFQSFVPNQNGEVHIYYGDGAGGFSSPDVFEVGTIMSRNLAIDDYNADGDPDIVLGVYNTLPTVTVSYIMSDGLGGFHPVDAQLIGGNFVLEVLSADVNLDGEPDLITTTDNQIGVHFFADGRVTSEETTGVASGTVKEVVAIGYNEAGGLEIAVSSKFENILYLYTISSDGKMVLDQTFYGTSAVRAMSVVDFDKNNNLDLIVPQQFDGNIGILFQQDDGFVDPAPVQVMDFDGLDDFIEIPDLRTFDDDFTWEGWIKTEDNGPLFSFVPEGDASLWDTENPGTFSLAIKGGELTFLAGAESPVAAERDILRDNRWHHVAVTFNKIDERIRLFIDGQQVIEDYRNISPATSDMTYVSKLGYATSNFLDVIGSDIPNPIGQSSESNWTEGYQFTASETGLAYSAYWTDNEGKFNVFGGKGVNGMHNSIRQFDPQLLSWSTLKGNDLPDEAGSYGVKGVSDIANIPSARWEVSAAVESSGVVWMFGGAAAEDLNGTSNEWHNDLWKYDPLTTEWVWVSGDASTNETGIYGTQGISDPANKPGARSNHKMWFDLNGDLWLFGGFGIDSQGEAGYLNDLWKYNTITNEWTWVSGSDLADQPGVFGSLDEYNDTNQPGGRYSMIQWIDSNDKLWIFGGSGVDKFGIAAGYLNDLWSYDPVLNQWAWHAGSDFKGSTGSYNQTGLSSVDYVPGSRRYGTGWIDLEDNLYLFGGYKFNQLSTSLYNDFWKYEPTTKEWTWLTGFNSTTNTDETGIYGGTKGEGTQPTPGSRHGGLAWVDPDGNFWMLGGSEGNGSAEGFYNDLWKYEPVKNEWSYIIGNTEVELNDGVYGSKGIGSSANDPKSRWHGAAWTGQDGKLWFFGGINYNTSIGNIAWLNDMWYFDPSSGVYTWIAGSNVINTSGEYGIKGEASVSHIPGARSSSAYWSDEEGNFWLFGGYESFEYNNDLWKFNPNTLEWTWVNGNNFQNSPGIYGEKGVASPTNSIGARRYTDGKVDQDGNVWVYGGDGHDSQAQRGFLNDLWKYNPTDNTWTWMSGTNLRNRAPNFGIKGVPSPDNQPPARYSHSMWIDDSGNIWIFGGFGLFEEVNPPQSATSTATNLNDLWKYDVQTNMWTWMGGSTERVNIGEYGTQGIFSEENIIPSKARSQEFGTFDKSLWLFGGRNGLSYNDFWQIKFTPGLPTLESPSEILQNGFSFSYDEPWATEYDVHIAFSEDFSDEFYAERQSTSSYTSMSLNPGSIYYYKVRAVNDIGLSEFSDPQQLLTLPYTPDLQDPGLAFTALTSTEVNISWAVTPGILDGYYLSISEDATFENETMALSGYTAKELPVLQAEFVSGLTPGTRYFVRIQSFNTSGNSPFSETLSFLTKPQTVTYNTETVISEVTQNSVVLTWDAVPEVLDGYGVTISTLDDGFTDAGAFLTAYDGGIRSKENTMLSIEGLTSGTFYYGRISAINSSGESDQPDKITILTAPSSPVFDLESAILTITQDEVTFNWEIPDGFFEGYFLEVSTDFSFANANLMLPEYGRGGTPKLLGQGDLTATVDGLQPGQTYFARIRAFNSAGVSPNSNILAFTTVPSSPTINAPNNITQTGASISWTSISGAEVYFVDLNSSPTFDLETTVFVNFPLAVPFIVIQDLEPGIRYYARVQSSNSSGDSGSSGTNDFGSVSFITIPNTPALNELSDYTQSAFTVSWPEVVGASSYIVDASDNFFQTFLPGFNQREVMTNQLIIENLSPGTEYQVRVRAKNESGSSPNNGIFDGETLPNTPIARDASSVSASVFSANWDPSDGADFYVLEVSKDDFQTFHYNEQLTSSNPVQMTNLTAGATYKYRVKSGNKSGFSPYSNAISVLAQNNAQSLNISTVDFDDQFGESATSTTVTATLSGGFGDAQVHIRYRGILSALWSELIEMNGSANTFTFEITSAMLDDAGVEFEIYANDQITFVESLGNVIKRSFSESESSELPSLVFSEWQMIAIPYILENKQVTSIFNELSSLEYKKGWRLMHYQDGGYLDAITGFSNIEIGLGYWLNVLEQVSINVGAGTTNSEIPFSITLKQGWNQIGNPFNTQINWNQILLSNSASSVDNLFIYDVTRKTFTQSNTLSPFTGAYVWADAETQLDIIPASGGGRTSNTESTQAIVGADGWKLPLSLEYQAKSLNIAAFGMNEKASDLKDTHDQLAPPRFESYIEMITTHEAAVYPYFMTDIAKRRAEHVWSFTLASGHLKGLVSLKWDRLELDRYFGLWLVDEKTGKVIDMKTVNQHDFYFNGSNDISLHYSEDPSYEVLPKALTLGDPYPNPTKGMTTVPLLLPEKAKIELSVYDLNGRKVKTLVDGEYQAGFHPITWNPSDDDAIKSGIYLYRLSFKEDASAPITKKLIIKK
ncbi:MAG: kelch repeat-containing protein [Ekhidna sp.]